MADLPAGTVTFAFTDIEGSTKLLKELGDEYGSVLSDHRQIVRGAFGEHGGVEIDTQGDAFFFAFVRARDAVEAAAKVQRLHAQHSWLGGREVRMRVGLHTGEPTVGEEGYLGLDVVRAARLCSSGQGGQVLLSESTRALVGSSLPAGVSVFPLGERHLKDIDEPERVYELEIEGVAAAVPADSGHTLSPPSSEDDLAEWEERIEARAEAFAKNTAEGVMGFLERTLSRLSEDADIPDEPLEGGLDEIVAHAEELGRRIQSEVERALSEED